MSTLASLLLIAVGSAIVNNVVLSQFLGICPFLGVSKNTKTAAGMGGAVIFVITVASFVTGLIYKFILANPALLAKGIDLTYLQTIVFILVIAALVQFVEMFLKKQVFISKITRKNHLSRQAEPRAERRGARDSKSSPTVNKSRSA